MDKKKTKVSVLGFMSASVAGILLLCPVAKRQWKLEITKPSATWQRRRPFLADIDGHAVALQARAGATVFENGEWACHKVAAIQDGH